MEKNVVATFDYEFEINPGYKQFYKVNFCDELDIDSDKVIRTYRFRDDNGNILGNFLIIFDVYLPKIKEIAKEPTKVLLLKDFITLLARSDAEKDLSMLLNNYVNDNNINM